MVTCRLWLMTIRCWRSGSTCGRCCPFALRLGLQVFDFLFRANGLWLDIFVRCGCLLFHSLLAGWHVAGVAMDHSGNISRGHFHILRVEGVDFSSEQENDREVVEE